MPSRCPPGVICIENMTITFVIIIIGMVVLYLTMNNKINSLAMPKMNFNMPQLFNNPLPPIGTEVLLNPGAPPLRDNRLYPDRTGGDPRGMPINIPTQGPPIDTEYRQVGLLTRINGPEQIIPLMGRPLLTNRDKWNFYTMKDGHNMIKLPITHNGRSCTSEHGCDNLYNGDSVYVEGYNDGFKVTTYDNNVMRYIPFI
jgi:hypothetical protein